MQLEPLGDQAVLAYCEDENAASVLARAVRHSPPTWCMDVVQAYVSVAVFYDGATTDFAQAAARIASDFAPVAHTAPTDGRLITIPCCYDLGLDFDRITAHTGLSRERIIVQHSETIYTVYAIGFCPGFPYLGYLPTELAGVPRLESPRLRVESGSVGMTGRQTGIYTEARPGGWNIIGRTPLTLVDVATEYFPLTTGDRVKFFPIDLAENERLQTRHIDERTT